ncbi:hypothetical protein EBR03_08315 [bacterium]|nr:hypothetical protein [bacterium]
MKVLLPLFLITLLSVPGISATDPESLIGQKAHYLLDKNPKRTTSMLKNGTFVAIIKDYHPNAEGGPAMEVDLDYEFDVQLVGKQQGVETGFFDQKYFTPEFLVELRKNGKYESENFKAIHQGYKDVKTLEGKFYAHCDVILVYDIKDSLNTPLRSGLAGFLALLVPTEAKADIQDLKALLHVYPGLPVLSAAQIDVSGKYEGMAVKAGADYVSPK